MISFPIQNFSNKWWENEKLEYRFFVSLVNEQIHSSNYCPVVVNIETTERKKILAIMCFLMCLYNLCSIEPESNHAFRASYQFTGNSGKRYGNLWMKTTAYINKTHLQDKQPIFFNKKKICKKKLERRRETKKKRRNL